LTAGARSGREFDRSHRLHVCAVATAARLVDLEPAAAALISATRDSAACALPRPVRRRRTTPPSPTRQPDATTRDTSFRDLPAHASRREPARGCPVETLTSSVPPVRLAQIADRRGSFISEGWFEAALKTLRRAQLVVSSAAPLRHRDWRPAGLASVGRRTPAWQLAVSQSSRSPANIGASGRIVLRRCEYQTSGYAS